MAIKIHWGDNGSYKTAGCVMDDIIPAIKEGRTIVTNIRGLSYEKCCEVFPNAPETFKLISLNLDSQDGLEKCRTWFKWVDRGALVVFDETQLVFLKSWKESDLKQFDYVGGVDKAFEDDRPSNWLDAWTRHRHFNWDVVLTTPNIKYIRQDIRDTSQSAYKHTNYGLLGPLFKKLIGDYKEVFHDSQSNQPSPKSISRNRRIDKTVFKLYESTATGVASKDFAGTSIFKSLPLLFALLVCILSIGYSFSSGGYSNLANGPKTVEKISGVSVQSNTIEVSSLSNSPVGLVSNNQVNPVVEFLNAHKITIGYSLSMRPVSAFDASIYSYVFETEKTRFDVNGSDLVSMGLDIEFYGPCVSKLTIGDWSKLVGCNIPVPKNANDKVKSYSL